MSKRYQLYRTQQLNCDIATAWKFFSSPYNLSRITPPEMNFTVLSNVKNVEIYEGMEIDYTVSPLFKIPLKWKTRIRKVDHEKYFEDIQEKGPYKFWKHKHEFYPNEKGVLMKDTVDFQLPLGVLGSVTYRLLVRKKLERIFDYRYQVLKKLFNQKIEVK